MLRCLLILILIISCGRAPKNGESETPYTVDPALEHKAEVYEELLRPYQDEHGFILTNTCDSLLFSGILSATQQVNILAARDNLGAWHRRPAMDCAPLLNTSRSTISKDMLIGLLYYFWYNKDLEAAEVLFQDLITHGSVLKGEGSLGELWVPPAIISTLAEIIKNLGGNDYPFARLASFSFDNQGGHIAHLNVWHILLRGQILGGITDSQLSLLKYHAERQPLNPLFSAAYHKYLDHNYADSVRLLLNPAEYPTDSLPTTANHCDDWPIQRDYSEKDYSPCLIDDPKQHTGAELILIYRLIIKS